MSRVIFISPYFAPAWGYGGPPRINYDLARFLVEHGHSVDVATTDVFDEHARCSDLCQELDGITVRRFRNVSNWLAWQGKLFLPYGFSAWLSHHISEYDFALLSDFRDYQNAIALPLLRRHKIPYALSAYGSLPRTGGIRGPVKVLYDQIWGYSLVREARYLLAQTDHERQEYLKLGGSAEQIVLLPLGINASQFRRGDGADFRKRYGISSDETVLLFVGRINLLKGIDFLIQALVKLSKTNKKLRLVIVGRDDGYYLARLKRIINEANVQHQVIFTGPLYGVNSYPAFSAADLFVFAPEHFEETSLACLNSLALGTPVVTTRQASIPLLEEYGAGYETERKLDLFVGAVGRAIHNRNDLRRMGMSGQRLIREVFDLSSVGATLDGLIQEAVHDRKK